MGHHIKSILGVWSLEVWFSPFFYIKNGSRVHALIGPTISETMAS